MYLLLMRHTSKSVVSKPISGLSWMLPNALLSAIRYLITVVLSMHSGNADGIPASKELPKNFKFIADGYSAYPLAAQQFFHEFGDKFKFEITQVIGLTNDDEVSKKFRPYKQMIERLNRTYKASYRKTNGFDNIDGANYDLALWVAYYNFLRPHKHNNYKVLNEVEMLSQADTMLGKWQLLIFLGQQTILNLQHGEAANCS